LQQLDVRPHVEVLQLGSVVHEQVLIKDADLPASAAAEAEHETESNGRIPGRSPVSS
jgi:hypothetical protein